ncbi:uncharacterized protein LOC131672514 [Phymastichus coffea]|uniref:uncharacterized protein LOC131672514 n=1 Tax=Phymastichus coffea TaxID=108790 RepID=UPI00273B4CFB|nr:uncharacterized protein LOC131672514 [Phymastichus coffea]
MSLLINKILEICLKVSGVWPYSVHILGPFLLLSTLVTTLPFQFWKVLLLFDNPVLLMDSLSDILAEILILIKLFAIWKSKSQINHLIRRIDDDWNQKSLPEEWKLLARYCYLFCKFDISLYVSAAVFYYPDLISTYLKKPIEARQLLFQSYYPFGYQHSPWYEILFLTQISQAIVMMSVDTLSKSLLVTYVLHIGARIFLMENYILKYSNSCSIRNNVESREIAENIKSIVIEHQNIQYLVQNIDNIYSYISIFQIIFSNVIICVTGFVMITAVESSNIFLLFKFVAYIIAMLSQAFTFCIAGQYLRNKGESLIYLIYNSFWYKSRPTDVRSVSFILFNAQKPLTLNGGRVIQLSINTFAQILKTSFSYLSVLRATNWYLGNRSATTDQFICNFSFFNCDEMKIPIIGKPVEYTLKISGLWPDYFNIFGVIFIMSGLFTLIPFQVWDIFKEFNNTFIILDDLSHLIGEIMLYSKFLIIWYHKSVFNSLLREMREDYENGDKIEDWSELISASHRFSKFDYAMYAGTASMYYIQFILNYAVTPVENREMMIRAQYPFDFKSSPMFEIMTLIQIVQGLACCCIQALSESLLVALVLHVCGHIDLLSVKVDEFSVMCMNDKNNISLKSMIKQHLKVLNIVHKVETVYTYASFIQVFLSTFMICCSGFIVLTLTDDVVIMSKFVMLCVSATWQGYSFCFVGQRLINESEKISTKIYNTFWYCVSAKEIRAVSYMINVAHLPLRLTAGKLISLSAQTFTSMMKTSFSYISVLKACNT